VDGWEQVYQTIRAEIALNHALMHWFTMVVAIVMLAGVWLCETRASILSVLLPLLAISWASATVRFDYLIHRQGAYLRAFENAIHSSVPMWETWKSSLHSRYYMLPVLDALAVLPIVASTIYLAFNPGQEYFLKHGWHGARIYASSVTVVLLLLIGSLAIVPLFARH